MPGEFSLPAYRRMLGRALETGYRFVRYDDVAELLPDADRPACLLRHDVDADLSAAVTMARLERELGVLATYFLMVRSPLYNLMSRRNHQHAETLLSLGHAIGLHYDQGFDVQRGWTPAETREALDAEAEWLERQFGVRVTAVSFHQPGPAVLEGQISTGDRINTYDRKRLAGFDYYSDSNRVFSLAQSEKGGLANAIAAHAPRNMHLLIHPMWWVYDDATTSAVWDRAILCNLHATQQQLLETERAYGDARQFAIQKPE